MKRLGITIVISLIFSFSYANSTLINLNGEKISFNQLKGKWVFINYWASWCNPCLEEISALNQFYRQHQQQVAVFAVNFDALPIEEQLPLVKKLGINYPSLAQDPGPLLGLEEVRGVPATFVFNPQGQWVDTLYGAQTLASLNQAITHQISDNPRKSN